MMDHEHDGGSTPSETNQLQPSAEQGSTPLDEDVAPRNKRRAASSAVSSFAAKAKQAFSRESLRSFGDKVHWPWIRSSSMGWLVGVAAAALFIQAVGLYNMLAVADEKQQWDASSTQRATIESELDSLLDRKSVASQELIAAKATLEHEQSRLSELRASLKIEQTLRDEAQREHATADAEAKRLQQENETLARRLKDLSVRLDATDRQAVLLETKRDALFKEVEASQAILSEHRAEVGKAAKHCQDLDKQAFDTLAAIRTTRESFVKAQAELDSAVRETAKAEAQRDAALTRLKNADLLDADATKKVASLRTEAATISQSLTTHQERLASLSAAKAKADASLQALQGDVEQVGKTLAESQGKLAATKTHIAEAAEKQTALKTEHATLLSVIKPLRDEQGKLAGDIAARQLQLKTLLDQINAAKKQVDENRAAVKRPAEGATQGDKKPSGKPAEPTKANK